MKKFITIILLALIFQQCNNPEQDPDKITIVCTTSMIGDAVKNIAPSYVNVVSLMGPGVDPHLYKATQGDLERLQKADVIVYNGLHLEGKMGDVLEKLSRLKLVLAMGDGVAKSDLLQLAADSASHDPQDRKSVV